jgi:methylation protein EvaC
MKCKFCFNDLHLINDFGPMPIANGFHRVKSADSYRFNLRTGFCKSCKLFQLIDQPDKSLMFNSAYPFFTGQSIRMKQHFSSLVNEEILPRVKDCINPFVVEIGSNDGTLLEQLKNLKIRHLGVDPSLSAVSQAMEKSTEVMLEFFTRDTSSAIKSNYGKANVVVAANVICHIPDLEDLFYAVKDLLTQDGVFIFEEPYLLDMLKKVAFDQIYDEHAYMFSVTSVKNICLKIGLNLFDAKPQNTHGGSMRYFVSNDVSLQETQQLLGILDEEFQFSLDELNTYLKFSNQCNLKKNHLRGLIIDLKSKKLQIAGYGATSKSTTVLNYCNITNEDIDYICDSTPEKIGCYAPGSNIPIISIQEMHLRNPDYMILFAWNHELEIVEKEKNIIGNSFSWIKYIPRVEVLSYE